MNQLDLKALKAKLDQGESQLYDGGYLEPDIKVIYDFYCQEKDKPPKITEYFQTFSEFRFLDFLSAYIQDTIGIVPRFQYDKDEWLEISVA